jgi:tetratricopeptide (TPR) repeat protein
VADNQRIDDLRRRVQKDPASIAFAQLAEECRRAGQFQEAVDVCRAGLKLHPGYLSARVTLGRALIELNELETALTELTTVLKSAPENLAAIRGVAEIHHRRNDLPAALGQYRAALALARNDPDLQRTVDELAREIEPPPPPPHSEGISFEQMHEIFQVTPSSPAASPAAPPTPAAIGAEAIAAGVPPAEDTQTAGPQSWTAAADATESPIAEPDASSAPIEFRESASPAAAILASTAPASVTSEPEGSAVVTPADAAQIQALQQFLDAIHGARAQRGA